ncbi:MAG: NAD(P)-binding domain-containing protein, partial [Candidatus Aenigmarchaeota archaeon]|nr:NAD(P)-binding domain-containing protein [Candidatus Aenigmarchaeota archaeon]
MKIGIVGLGKMGGNIAKRLASKGYEVLAYDSSGATIKEAKTFRSLGEMASALGTCAIILSVPHTAVDDVLSKLSEKLGAGSTVIDAGNSYYKDTVKRSAVMKKRSIDFLDAGCSGGPSGALNGMSIMVGGEKKAFEKNEKLFKDLSVENGYAYFGPSGAGHFVKMVHNAIEYGMMQSIGEGFDLLANGPYAIDLKKASDVWQNGSVIRSYLMELSTRALEKDEML